MDVDGTIFDTMPIYEEIFAEILFERCKIPKEISRNFYKDSAEMPLLEQFATILKSHNCDVNLAYEIARKAI